MTERRIVVLAFIAFLAVGTVIILVTASQPVSNPAIQSGRDAATTRPPRATTSSTTLSTVPQPPIEVKGESATSGTAEPAATTSPPVKAPPTAAVPTAAPPTATPPTAAPPTAAPPTAAPRTATPPTAAPPTAAPPTTAPPPTKKPKPNPPGQSKP